MNSKKQFYTFRYTLINILYFMSFCTVHAFAAVYLLDKGFSNTEIGILLAVANIFSALLQPYVAGLIDKQGKFTNRNVIMGSSGLIMLGSILLLFVGNIHIIVFIVFALIYMIQFVYQPVITALVFEYQKAGANIFYGLARGLGSAGFAVTSAFMGNAVESFGVKSLLIVTAITMAALILVTFFFKKPVSSGLNQTNPEDKIKEQEALEGEDVVGKNYGEEPVAHNNLFEFAKLYPVFMVLLLATVLLFFGHNMLNDYLIQIITSVGGSEKNLGYATFLAAILELPTMATISLIIKKVNPKKLLMMAGVFFTVKVIVMLFATNMIMVYASQACQLLAYAAFIPSAAYYVNEHLQELDQVKGQAFISSGITLGGVLSGIICGPVLDKAGVKTMLIIGLIVSVVGTLAIIKAMLTKEKK